MILHDFTAWFASADLFNLVLYDLEEEIFIVISFLTAKLKVIIIKSSLWFVIIIITIIQEVP